MKEIINERNMIKKRSKSSNQKNNLHLGKLDEETIFKLKDWIKSGD